MQLELPITSIMAYLPRLSRNYGLITFNPKVPVEKPEPGRLPLGYRLLPVGIGRQPILLPTDMYWNHRTKLWMITNFPGQPAMLTDQYITKS